MPSRKWEKYIIATFYSILISNMKLISIFSIQWSCFSTHWLFFPTWNTLLSVPKLIFSWILSENGVEMFTINGVKFLRIILISQVCLSYPWPQENWESICWSRWKVKAQSHKVICQNPPAQKVVYSEFLLLYDFGI